MEGSVSDVLLAIVKKHGVRYICGLPAAQIGLLMHGASRDPDFKYVTTQHEEAAGHMAHPDRPVICITGDGALGCTVQELETAARYGLNIVVIVFNDSYWGMYKPFGELLQNPEFGTRLTTVDFAKVAEGFGCYGQNAASLDALPGALRRALQAGRPSVINVEVEYTAHPMDFMWPSIILHGFQFPMPQEARAVA